MICGHCGVALYDGHLASVKIGPHDYQSAGVVELALEHMSCPQCGKLIVYVAMLRIDSNLPYGEDVFTVANRYLVFPKVTTARPFPSNDVPAQYANDYYEACKVINDSPKASAALSRRCLQNILHHHLKIKSNNLDNEIDEWIKTGLPSNLTKTLHMIRTLGNYAAHPKKSNSTGEIIDVEPGEAEWSLDTLEAVFDHVFVQPAEMQRKLDALNAKLASAGKPIIK